MDLVVVRRAVILSDARYLSRTETSSPEIPRAARMTTGLRIAAAFAPALRERTDRSRQRRGSRSPWSAYCHQLEWRLRRPAPFVAGREGRPIRERAMADRRRISRERAAPDPRQRCTATRIANTSARNASFARISGWSRNSRPRPASGSSTSAAAPAAGPQYRRSSRSVRLRAGHRSASLAYRTRPGQVTALSLFSSFMTRLEARREASSMQTGTNSQHRVQIKPTLLLR